MDTSFHYTAVILRVWDWQSQKCNSKCPNDINTEWAIPENFSNIRFLLYPWKCHILNPPPSLPPLFFFFHYSVILWFLNSTILLIQPSLPIAKSTLQLKIHIWMEFFWNQKFLFFHKRNFNHKLFLIKLSADISWYFLTFSAGID